MTIADHAAALATMKDMDRARSLIAKPRKRWPKILLFEFLEKTYHNPEDALAPLRYLRRASWEVKS